MVAAITKPTKIIKEMVPAGNNSNSIPNRIIVYFII